jgi:hypothetical protein
MNAVTRKNPGLYFGLANCPDVVFWFGNERQNSSHVRFIEPHGLHHESENKVQSKAQDLVKLVDLSRQDAFRKRRVEMDGWILSATTKISDIPWAGKRGWSKLKSGFKVLSMADDYMPTILNVREGLQDGD